MVESNSLRIIPFLLFFTFFSYVFSPSIAQNDIIVDDNNNFLSLSKDNIKKILFLTVTGYSSSFEETDDTPWITAYNTFVRDGIVASNFLPFGTKLKIPSLFNDKVFIVEDKMNPRYGENIDIWFPSKWEAQNFGIHYNVLVEILK